MDLVSFCCNLLTITQVARNCNSYQKVENVENPRSGDELYRRDVLIQSMSMIFAFI